MDDEHDTNACDGQTCTTPKRARPMKLDPASLRERRESAHANLVMLVEQVGSLAGETALMAHEEVEVKVRSKLVNDTLALSQGLARLCLAEMELRDRLDQQQ